MTQRVQFPLPHLAADGAGFLHKALGLAAGGGLAALHLDKIVVMGIRRKVRRDDHAAGVGVGGNGEGQAGAAAGRPDGSGPVVKLPAAFRHGGHGGAGAALLDQLAGGTADRAAAGRDKLHRDLGAAHGDRVGGDQPQRYAVRLRDGAQRLRAAVFGLVGVGAHILKVGGHGRFAQVDAVGQGVILLGPAGGVVPQHFCRIEELVPVGLAHLHQSGVVGVHLGHGQVGVFPLLVQRRDRADDQVCIGPGFHDGFEPFFVSADEAGGVGG